MKIYHGSKNGKLKKLTTDYAKFESNGAVYLAESYEFAVFYAGCPIRYWGTDETGKLIIREQCEHGLEIMYKNKHCFVYAVDDGNLGEYEFEIHNRRRARKYFHDIDLTKAEKEYIPNVLEKLLQLEKENKIIIQHWENYSEEEKQKIKQANLKLLSNPYNMQIEYFDYPEEYKILVKMFPEAKIKPDKKKYKEALIWLEELKNKEIKKTINVKTNDF